MKFVFDTFASSVLNHYVLVFCVILWQSAVFCSVLVLYLRTQNTLNLTSVKSCKYYSRTYSCFYNHFCALSIYTVQLTSTIKVTPVKMNCGISMGWKDYCGHFVLQHAHVNLNFFHSYSSVKLQSSFQKALQNSFHLLLQTWKPNIQISNSQQLFQNVTNVVIFLHTQYNCLIALLNTYRKDTSLMLGCTYG